MRKYIKFLFAAIFLLSLVGCVGMNIKGSIQNNTYSNLSLPDMKLKINEDIKYLGMRNNIAFVRYRNHNSAAHKQGSYYEREHYLFGQGEQNTLNKIVLINTLYADDASWIPNQFQNWKNALDRGQLMVENKLFHYAVQAFYGAADKYTKNIALENQYVFPNCLLTIGISQTAGVTEDTRIDILYMEDINITQEDEFQCKKWWKTMDNLKENQMERMEKFIIGFKHNVQFINSNGDVLPYELINSNKSLIKFNNLKKSNGSLD